MCIYLNVIYIYMRGTHQINNYPEELNATLQHIFQHSNFILSKKNVMDK